VRPGPGEGRPWPATTFVGVGLPEGLRMHRAAAERFPLGSAFPKSAGFAWDGAGSNPVGATPLWPIGKGTRMVGGIDWVRFPSAAPAQWSSGQRHRLYSSRRGRFDSGLRQCSRSETDITLVGEARIAGSIPAENAIKHALVVKRIITLVYGTSIAGSNPAEGAKALVAQWTALTSPKRAMQVRFLPRAPLA
jgi:hypothetical protein